ncbi:MAG: nuclear transport factor 2 family protein [Pseudomonadota bacterium]
MHAAHLAVSACCLLTLAGPPAQATDACSPRAIVAAAEVDVSDGSALRVESFYHSPDSLAVRHVTAKSSRFSAIEGPVAWTASGEEAALGDDETRVFALAHQFHALLLDFAVLAPASQPIVVTVNGEDQPARLGRLPYGGTVALIMPGPRPYGLRITLPDGRLVQARFSDWRAYDGLALPYDMVIDDGERTFSYRYSYVDPSPRPPTWFYSEIEAPALDAVRLYRLHRQLLAAHCRGDAPMLAALSSANMVLANDGRLVRTNPTELRNQFTQLFRRLRYEHYEDLQPPAIEVAASGDLAWVAVQVRAQGLVRGTDRTFDDRWAWVMLARKEAGDWVHAGNASSREREP